MNARADIAAHFTSDTLAEHLLDAHRDEVLDEAKREVIAWLVKKAREGTPIEQLASKVDRGAVRIFIGTEPYAEPLIVDRFDTAMEPAPEEASVFVVGAIAENGRPVALCFDPEDRRKVGRWLAPDEEKATPTGATATPEPTGRVAQLLDAIRTHRGRWNTSRVAQLYRDMPSMTDVWATERRAVARGDLRDLCAWGHLVLHDEPSNRHYTLATRKDATS